MQTKETYWRTYVGDEMAARAEAVRTTAQVESIGVQLHVDIYPQKSASAPVFIFNHGGGGYSRLFTPLALALHARGYTVLLPDQIGQGLSGGSWRDLSIEAFVQNVVDVVHWARAHYKQAEALFMGGGSLGGGLTYHAAAAGAPVDGIVCHNLYEFGRATDVLAMSRFAWAASVPGLPDLVAAGAGLLARLAPDFPLPYRLLGRFDRMVDRREANFYDLWQADPAPLQRVTLRYLSSLFTTRPRVPYARNRLPVLVINPVLDEMVDPAVTRRNFERLGGPKAYAELPYGHWSLDPTSVESWVTLVDDWCRAQMGRLAAARVHRVSEEVEPQAVAGQD